jgi:hypothetical protein
MSVFYKAVMAVSRIDTITATDQALTSLLRLELRQLHDSAFAIHCKAISDTPFQPDELERIARYSLSVSACGALQRPVRDTNVHLVSSWSTHTRL